MRDGESGFDAPGMESTFVVLTEYKERKGEETVWDMSMN